MTDQHRATPEQWEHVAICAGMKQRVPWATAACLLELRSRIEALEQQNKDLCIAVNNAVVWNTEQNQRIEALEAAQLEQAESHRFCTDAIVRRVEALEDPMTELRAASADLNSSAGLTSSPGGLVERVACAMGPQSQAAMDAGELPHGAACAAIREVAAAALQMHPDKNLTWERVALWLEQEADRG